MGILFFILIIIIADVFFSKDRMKPSKAIKSEGGKRCDDSPYARPAALSSFAKAVGMGRLPMVPSGIH